MSNDPTYSREPWRTVKVSETHQSMKSTTEIDTLRQAAILSSLAGFPFLLVYSLVWITAAAVSYLVPSGVAPWIYILGGIPAAPMAIALERRVGYVRVTGPDPLLPLTLQILFVQIVAFPAIMLVWSFAPNYVPVAFAAVVGAHFLPFQWVYRTRPYGFLGVAVAGGAYLVAAVFGEQSIHYTGFFVGATLLVGAFVARSHARATWLESRQAAEHGLALRVGSDATSVRQDHG